MKYRISLALAFALLVLTGCGDTKPTAAPTQPVVEVPKGGTAGGAGSAPKALPPQ